jgi:hypothetical protein
VTFPRAGLPTYVTHTRDGPCDEGLVRKPDELLSEESWQAARERRNRGEVAAVERVHADTGCRKKNVLR